MLAHPCCPNVLNGPFKYKAVVSFLAGESLAEVLVVVEPVLLLTLPGDETNY